MSDELYYRGSTTYELAVKNRLDTLERSGIRNANAVLNGLQNMEYGVRSDIRESTYAVIASQQALANTFANGFDSVNSTLQIGFEMMFEGMAGINNSINAICDRLDAIHDIVNNPRLTAARELFRSASANFEKGYFEEALEDCKQAVEKEKTDFISWYLLGQIYLFGAGKFSNVINLKEAETAFINAAKYIDADLDSSEEAKELGSQIYYHLAYTKWLLSNDLLIEKNVEESNLKLGEAEKNSAEAFRLNDKNLKARYENAKQLHFLGKDDQALAILEKMIRDEKNYALLATTDKNFESIWSDIEKVILKLRDEFVPLIKQKCSELSSLLESETKNNYGTEWNSKFSTLQSAITNLVDGIENKDYFFVRDCWINEIPKLANRVEDEKSAAIKAKKAEEKAAEEAREAEEAAAQEIKNTRYAFNLYMVIFLLCVCFEFFFAFLGYEKFITRILGLLLSGIFSLLSGFSALMVCVGQEKLKNKFFKYFVTAGLVVFALIFSQTHHLVLFGLNTLLALAVIIITVICVFSDGEEK